MSGLRSYGAGPRWLLALALAVAGVSVAAPPLVSYQGVLLDASGSPRNSSAALEFRLFTAATGGVPLWSETHAGVPVVDGVFHVLLGSIAPLDVSLVSGNQLWLEIRADAETLAPRQRVVSSFFALRAESAERLLQSCAEGDMLRFVSGAWQCTPVGACIPGQSQACYSGPPATQNVGQCQAGQQTCGALGQPGTCTGEVLPGPEICATGQDEDCDGLVDEGCGQCTPGQVRSCYSGPAGTANVGICRAGSQTCSGVSLWGPCTGEVVPGGEVCNAVDDDCDGTVDEVVPGACVTGLAGICASGSQACLSGALTCIPNTLPGTQPDVCNGVDDDCDGLVDEVAGESCSTGLPGVCAAGVQLCNGGVPLCQAAILPGWQVETCNGLDDDCDGEADEGCAGIAAARDQPDGPVNVPVVGALVSYVRPLTGSEQPAFFIQQDPGGPALLIAIDPATLSPVLAVGDRIDFTITQMATALGMRMATGLTGLSRTSSGNPSPFQEVTFASDLVGSSVNYEAELVSVRMRVTGTAAGAGANYSAATIATAGVIADPNLRLRVPAGQTIPSVGSCLQVQRVPIVRVNSIVYVSSWSLAERVEGASFCPP